MCIRNRTCGAPQVTDVVPRGLGRDAALYLAAALEQNSEHPLARAIVAESAIPQGHFLRGAVDRPKVQNFKALPGHGIEGEIDGRLLRLGSPAWLGLATDPVLLELQQAGKTVVVLAEGDQVLALFAIADALRPTSRAAVAGLRERGIRVVMLTGDNAATAAAIAAEAGIAEFRAEILPGDKAAAIMQLKVCLLYTSRCV